MTSPEQTFEDFREKKIVFLIASSFYPEKIIQVLAEKNCQACQQCNRNLGVQRRLWGKTTFLRKLYVLLDRRRTSSQICQNFGQNSSARLSKLLFRCSGENLSKDIFLQKAHFSIIFVTLVRTFGTSGKKNSAGLWRLHSKRECTEENVIFWKD